MEPLRRQKAEALNEVNAAIRAIKRRADEMRAELIAAGVPERDWPCLRDPDLVDAHQAAYARFVALRDQAKPLIAAYNEALEAYEAAYNRLHA